MSDDGSSAGVGRTLLSAAFWGYLGSSSLVLWLGAVVVRTLSIGDPNRRLLHRYTCFWAYHYVVVCPFWNVTFEGLDNIEDGRPYVLVANHQSSGDILVMFGLGKHYKWVSKASVFKVPFIGWNMVMNDYVKLRRGDRGSIEEMMDACRRHLRAGSSVFIFPEGTRSRDGEIKDFKHGAFTLATELEIPVVPIVVDGTMNALPKNGWVFQNGRRLEILVRVLKPVDPNDYACDRERLQAKVRELMVDELREIRRPVSDRPPRV